jgi:hypothetical protein
MYLMYSFNVLDLGVWRLRVKELGEGKREAWGMKGGSEGVMGRQNDGELGRRGDGERGRWGDGETGR